MTATYPARTDLRPCRLYRFYVTHPLTGEIVLGYVGETGRQPFERLLEHLSTQPWFDTVVRWEVDPQVYYGKQAVLEAETAAIRAERPLYNVKKNEGNRKRIIPAVAIRQRRARDAQAREPRWVHPDDRGLSTRPDRASPPVRQRSLKPWEKRSIIWGSAWLVLWTTGWVLDAHRHLTGHHCRDSVIAATVLLIVTAVWLWLDRPVRGRTWKRQIRRKLKRRRR